MSSAAAAYTAVPVATRSALSEFELAFVAGLRRSPKELACKYFYDNEGSALFDEICALPEYYLTRTETALLRQHAGEMAALIGSGIDLVEFGAGSLQKVEILLDTLESPHAYMPVDISGEHLGAMAKNLARRYPRLRVEPVVADFTHPFKPMLSDARRVGFFPGSTIGNFDHAEAVAFLRRTKMLLNGGGLLIGVDLVKDPAILHAAYNDASGVTAAFNKNILARANRELDANFSLDAFAHYAFYDPRSQRVEMHLVSTKHQRVRVAGEPISFAEGETVHTEISQKYTLDSFRALGLEAGFTSSTVWCDPARLFSIHWLQA
jgi:L-histidine Nalpha-methyltransferase